MRDWREQRPSYIHCISEVHEERKDKVWCGESKTGWNFVDLDHAILNARNKGRLLICHKCWEAVIAATKDQVADGDEEPDPKEEDDG